MGKRIKDIPFGKKDERHFIEIELGNKNRKIFIIIYPFEEEIYIDTQGLPETAILCAICDGTPMLVAKCGTKKKHERNFLPIEWVINQWGGDQVIVDAVKKRKEMIMENMQKYRDDLSKPEEK